LAEGLLDARFMATSFVSAALRRESTSCSPHLSSIIFVLFLLGLVAGGAGFAFLVAGHVGWAQTLFVSDLVAMLSSVSLGAVAPRAVSHGRGPRRIEASRVAEAD